MAPSGALFLLGDNMIITTSYKINSRIMSIVDTFVQSYPMPYVERKKLTLKNLFQIYNCPIIIVTNARIIYATETGQLYFHPNLAQVRSKRIELGQSDAMLSACGLSKGMRFLDCTMGLGSDSLIASQVVGADGEIVSLESSSIIHMIVSMGMRFYPFENPLLAQAASRIKSKHIHYLDYLKNTNDNAFDVVYFDPMFDESIKEDTPLEALQMVADYNSLDIETITEAKRVAKKYVIMKNHYTSDRFRSLGFTQLVRKTSQFHYGVIDVDVQ